MIISIVGNVDKRVVAYPLMRALAVQGKTTVVTDDTSFKRLYLEDSNNGVISNVNVIIVEKVTKESIDLMSDNSEEVINKVFISNNYIYEGSDKTIILRGIDRSMSILRDIDEDDLEDTEEIKNNEEEEIQKVFEIVVTTVGEDKKKVDKKKVTLITGEDLKYLWDIEENKELLKVSKNLVKIVEPIVMSIYQLDKLEAEKLINRDFVSKGK